MPTPQNPHLLSCMIISRRRRAAVHFSTLTLALTLTACGSDPAAPPAEVTSRGWTSVVAGRRHSCALDAEGAAYCWGQNSAGQLGIIGMQDRAAPVAVLGTQRYTALAAGNRFTCGLARDGKVWCWGDNTYGQLGGTTTTLHCLGTPCSIVPVAVMDDRTYTAMDAGAGHVCAIAADGAAWCWGMNNQLQLGDTTRDTTADSPTPVAVRGGLTFTRITVGQQHSCGLSGLTTYCWGSNFQQQLGTGSTASSSATPVPVSGHAFNSLSAGGRHNCATQLDQVWCWGANENGQQGTGSAINWAAFPWHERQREPLEVPGLAAPSVATGEYHSCALGADGAVSCWGANGAGQLGAESTETCEGQSCASSPAARVGMHTFVSLALGTEHSCGITTGNRLFCWGSNHSGQLGSGPVGESRMTPSEVF
jgi:alpha-tubulin suppressor-like RCC1 family protein